MYMIFLDEKFYADVFQANTAARRASTSSDSRDVAAYLGPLLGSRFDRTCSDQSGLRM